jgi:hypothetical protein
VENSSFSERKLKDYQSAKGFFDGMWKDGESRRKSFARILNQLNGGKPFDDRQLELAGQGWRTNVNFRDASSTLEQVLIAYWRMLHDVTNLAVIEVRTDDRDKEVWENLFQQAFDDFHDDWGPDYVRNYLQQSVNHVGLGIGLGMFDGDRSPRWSAARLDEVLVPERTKAAPGQYTSVAIRQEIPLDKLYEHIRTPANESAAEARGWNTSELRRVLHLALKSKDIVSGDDYLKVEDAIRDNSLWCSTQTDQIRLVHILNREYDGMISRVTIAEKLDAQAFLFDDYKVPSRPKKFEQIMFALFFEAGDGTFYGSKGFGQKNFGLALINNRLKSRAVDRTVIDGLNFRDLSGGARETIPITNIGPFNFLPADVEQLPDYPTGRAILETIAMLDAQSSYNNARFRDQSNQISQADTATQANILAQLQSQVDVANATLYLKQYARNIFEEQFRRLRIKGSTDPDAVAFRKKCIEDGKMPEKLFYESELKIRTGADPGMASAALRAQIGQQLMSIAPGNRDIDGRAATEMYVRASLGASAVKKLMIPQDQDSDPAATRMAILENTTMGDGIPVPVPPKDPHEVHAPVHLQALKGITDRFQQSGQVDPGAMIALQNGIPHAKVHLLALKDDPLRKSFYQQFWPIFSEVEAIANGMFNQVQKMAAEQESAASLDPTGRSADPRQALSSTPQAGPVGAGMS